MPETEALIKLGRRIWARLRKRSSPVLPKAQNPDIVSSAGYRLSCRWFTHENPKAPTLILCPDYPMGAVAFLEERYPISCGLAYQQGYNLMIFDPAGRGKSWGTEDYGGLAHQDNVAVLLDWIHQQLPESTLGVFSVGCGLAMALGGIVQSKSPVSFLIDFEGPCDRFFLAQCYGITTSKSDEHFWKYREPTKLLRGLECQFLRLQAERDHLEEGYS